ncbi:aldehyde dehydrogenase family protein [Metabacillus sp. Hm71]|uniref:aldehyde dehydrogenase family protein n=1 Tax=Metabacillus sp. Hm71 TaxID=3450743 RepID=UPI003F425FC5
MPVELKNEHYPLYINGKWIETKERTEVKNKYTNETFATMGLASSTDVDSAISSARKTFDTEKRLSPYKRYEILKKAADLLLEEKDELAKIITMEVGKPYKDSLVEVERAAQTIEISAEEAKRIHGEGIPVEASPGSENRMAFTIRVPVGVVCAITPFNVPLNLVAHKIAPALAAGNTVVLKPAEKTPIIAAKFVQILERAGLPAGYLNMISGPGSVIGELLIQDPRINLYTFTGSPSVGLKIKNGIGLRKASLELGSNSAVIVHDDADLEKAAALCAGKSFANAGQVCISVQRIYVHRSVEEEFLAKLKAATDKLVVGDPFSTNTDIGPMISEQEAQRAEDWVNEAVEQGAKLVTGGRREGSLYYPTILSQTKADMKVICEEVFAPIVSVIAYDTLDEAYSLVNQSKYGLQAGIFTSSLNIAMEAAKKIHTGGLMINDASQYRADQMPYGGVKESGWGKEGPKYAIEEMTEERIVVINL